MNLQQKKGGTSRGFPSSCPSKFSTSQLESSASESISKITLSPDQQLYNVIRYIKVNQEVNRLLRRHSLSDANVVELVSQAVEDSATLILQQASTSFSPVPTKDNYALNTKVRSLTSLKTCWIFFE